MVGRKKRERFTRLAVQVKCGEEHCESCDNIVRKFSIERRYVFLFCKFFKKPLVSADGELVAERCSDCHMAERCACGESLY